MQLVSKKLKKAWGRLHDLWTSCFNGINWLCHCRFMEGRKMTGLATLGYDI